MKERGGMGFISSGHLRKATFQQAGLCNCTSVQAQTPSCWMNAEGPHPKTSAGRIFMCSRPHWASQVAPVLKNPPANAGDIKRPGFDPWAGKIPWRRSWQPTPVFWRIPMDRGTWRATVHGVPQSRTRLKQLCKHVCTYPAKP